MRVDHPVSELFSSLDAIGKLTTYCKTHAIQFEIKQPNGGASYYTSPCNPAKTRWLGLLRQVNLYVKAKASVQARAALDQQMLAIADNINWQLLENWLSCCKSLKIALLHGQLSNTPNIHYCILDLMIMFTEVYALAP